MKSKSLLFTIIGVFCMASLNCQAGGACSNVRKPAVAGQFYPANAAELREDIATYCSDAKKLASPPQMLISPHAGYVFSGPVAGKGYATIDKATTTVIVLGPSHYVSFTGLALPDADCFETPLGMIELDKNIMAELSKSPLVQTLPEAHRQEHSLEAQLPFLQARLSSFKLVPIVTGRLDPETIARLLKPFVKEHVLVVASSDLSHYHPSDEAKKIDSVTVKNILDGNADGEIDACGETPIRIVMHLAKMFNLSPVLLDKRNSYETAPQYGPPDRVVGYASIAYVSSGQKTVPQKTTPAKTEKTKSDDLDQSVKSYLLKLARTSLEAAVNGGTLPDPTDVPAVAKDNKGCFVTLTVRGQLRGCIGYIEPIKPLFRAVIENASNAALEDPRFPAVTPVELKNILLEVSVLTVPQPLTYSSPDDLLNKLRPNVDGVILKKGFHQSTFLPQVWEDLSDKTDFLEHLSLKGGMDADGWKTAEVKTYQAIHFQEK